MTQSGPILVAGGGIGGLATAIALAGIGQRVHVLEQRRAASEEGAGIQIGPNGVHALRALGIARSLESVAGCPEAIALYDGRSGRALSRLPLRTRMEERFGAPYWVTRRDELHAALLERVRGLPLVEVTTGFRIEGVAFGANGIRLASDDGRMAAGRGLVGADGLWSVVATTVLAGARPRFAGRTAARALVAADAVSAPFNAPLTGLWLGPKAHLVHYPVQGGAFVNIVAITEGGRENADWGAPADPADLRAAFSGWAGPVRQLLQTIPGWRQWSLYERPDLAQWTKGAVTVVGDAAHPLLPFLAKGAVLALEDAVSLAAAVAHCPDDLATAFRVYAAARQARAHRVVRASRRNGILYHLTGPAAIARNLAIAWMEPERLIGGYDWLYAYRTP